MLLTKSRTTIGKRKVAIIGAGFVGASIAYSLTIRNLAREIVLIDINTAKAEGEALDIQHGIPYMGISSVRSGDYSDCAGCDLIIITAGQNRRPGQSRLDLISANTGIMRNVLEQIMQWYDGGVLMIVSNPVDILVQKCCEWTDLPNGRILGTGCILDTSRMIRLISDYVHLNTEVIKGFVVGEHGDGQIPVWSRLAVAGVPMEEYCQAVGLEWTSEIRADIAARVKGMGAEIIRAKGQTHYGIATCVCSLADAILNQRPTIASVCTQLRGEYGIHDVCLSVPSIVGVSGVERRLEERWAPEELAALQAAGEKLKQVIRQADES